MIIDTDAHVEEHPAMFARLAEDPAWAALAPRVVEGPDRAYWWIGARLVPNPHGWGAMTAGTPHRPAATEDPTRRSHVGSQLLTDPAARLQEMDAEGIDLSVVFPTLFLLYPLAPDPGLATALCQAYNDWMAETLAPFAQRLKWVATLPHHDPEAAVAALERAVAQGAVGVQILGTAGETAWDHPMWEPLWAAAERAAMPICVHVGWSQPSLTQLASNIYTSIVGPFVLPLMTALTSFIGGRILDRHPRLKVGFFEGGVEWAPFWLDRLARFYRQPPGGMDRRLLPDRHPLEYVRDGNVVFSCELDEARIAMAAEAIGNDAIVYASDLPHSHRVFDAIGQFRARTDLDEETKAKILSHNGLRFYGARLGVSVAEGGSAG